MADFLSFPFAFTYQNESYPLEVKEIVRHSLQRLFIVVFHQHRLLFYYTENYSVIITKTDLSLDFRTQLINRILEHRQLEVKPIILAYNLDFPDLINIAQQ